MKSMTIDRIEGNVAVVEISKGNKIQIFDIPIIALPEGAKEGDILTVSIDKERTMKEKQKNRDLEDSLFETK